MKNRVFKGVLLTGIIVILMSFDFPGGWFKAGSVPRSYEMGIDKGAGQNNTNAATIKSIDKQIDGFGTLMQNCSPGKYLGKRVRMSGYMKTKDVSGWAGFWFRVDQKGSDEPLAFDNMHDGTEDRSIKGTTDWKKYEIILDVPENASNLAYGALEVGTGQIWFDDLTFEIVGNSLPATGREMENQNQVIVGGPINLDFEENQTVSDNSNVTSILTVKNNLEIPLSFYWVDFTGKEIIF